MILQYMVLTSDYDFEYIFIENEETTLYRV
jgi:hypothetical protein